jgi:hypothetical protein
MRHTGGLLKPVVSPSMSRSKAKAILTVAAGLKIRQAILGGLLPRSVKASLQDRLFIRVPGRDVLQSSGTSYYASSIMLGALHCGLLTPPKPLMG